MIVTIGSIIKDNKNNIYKIVDFIGQGGFGSVFKAIRKSDEKVFAVKTLLQSFSNSNDFISFKNEIALAQEVIGKNIIKYEFIHNGELFNDLPPYIIMEYADGGTLGQDIKKRRENKNYYTNSELKQMFLELANGMKLINEKLIHRDIKPENILISSGVLKISDFGLAKFAADSTRSQTLKGYGTYKYIAPEGWNLEKNTIQMDIYSMGIVFYELATLEYPYNIIKGDIEEYKSAHLFSSVKNIKLLEERTTPEICSMIIKMMEKSKQSRFKNWNDIIKHLNNYLTHNNNDVLRRTVNITLQAKIQDDIKKQQEIEEETKKQNEILNLCNLVKYQFENDVCSILDEFVDEYKSKSPTPEECKSRTFYSLEEKLCKYNLSISSLINITIKCKIILKNSFPCVRDDIFGEKSVIMITPQVDKKNVMAFVDVNNGENGFNLLLLQSNEIYGDWFVADNKENFALLWPTKNNTKKGGFSFGVNELDRFKSSYETTDLYVSKLTPFSKNVFLERISFLIRK